MGVSIRLTRLGCKHNPFYRVVATDSKAGRDGKSIEVLGFYNPIAGKDDEKSVSLKLERVKYWLSVGAQPSETAASLIFQAGLVPRPGGKSEKYPVDAFNGDTPNQEQPNNGVSPEDVLAIGLPVN